MDKEVSRIAGWYEVVTKDNDGVATVHRLYKDSTKTRPAIEVNPDLFITQAAPTVIRPGRVVKHPRRTNKLGIVVPDIQIGYRGDEPFHDEQAMAKVQEVIRREQPDEVMFIGDCVDLPALSRHSQRSDWQQSTQAGLDRFHAYLAQTRANAPNAHITVQSGNHEARLEAYIRRNAAELLGIRRANAESELGVLTMQHLLRTDELEVDYYAGYPNNEYWLTDNLKVVHGDMSRTNGSTAAAMVRRYDHSVIFGHTHRIEVAHRTIQERRGPRFVVAASFGTLSRIDGAVPAGRHATDEANQLVGYVPNWQQGFGIVEYNTERHQVTPAQIFNEAA